MQAPSARGEIISKGEKPRQRARPTTAASSAAPMARLIQESSAHWPLQVHCQASEQGSR